MKLLQYPSQCHYKNVESIERMCKLMSIVFEKTDDRNRLNTVDYNYLWLPLIFVITPDMSGYLGSENKGLFFGYYVVSTIIVRLFSARLSDKIGRRKTLIIGFTLLLTSMLLIGFSRDLTSYITAAIIFGFATGVSSPTLFAWTADLSHPERRGVGAGTMFIALEAGIISNIRRFIFYFIIENRTRSVI